MLHRYTIALVLVAVAAGACSGSQNEGVSPGTAASTITDATASTTIGGAVSTTVDAAVSTTAEFVPPSIVAAVPSTAIPVAAATPAAATVPEAEVPPSTASPAGTAPETSAPTETAVPATTIPDAAAPPVAATVPEGEVPPSTVSPAGTAPETSAPAVTTVPSTTVPEILLRNGVAMVGWDLTVETAEVVDAAVGACSEVFETSIMAGCVAAVWEVCYSHRSSYGKMYRSTGVTNIEEPRYIKGLTGFLCTEAYTAEVVELASVLAAKYGDRYYSEDTSMPYLDQFERVGQDVEYDLQDFEDDYIYAGDIYSFVFREGVKRDFIDFRMYVHREGWAWDRVNDEIFVGGQDFTDEAHVRINPLFEIIDDLQYAFSDLSSGPFGDFDAGSVIEFYAEDVVEVAGSNSLDHSRQSVELLDNPDEIKLFCDEAAYAARIGISNWENDVNSCIVAVENCIDDFAEVQNRICTDRLLYDARAELMWKKLPAICASAEDIKVGDYNDSCRQSVLDLHMLRIGPSIHTDGLLNQIDDRLQYHWTRSWNSRYASMVWHATFFLAQPLIADLPIKYRVIRPLPGP